MNALKEFNDHTWVRDIKCVYITKENFTGFAEEIILKINYSEPEYLDFILKLDFEYDNNSEIEYLSGIIWYNDGSWSCRRQIAGYEVWDYNICPSVIAKCL